jgi:hypothetical protein
MHAVSARSSRILKCMGEGCGTENPEDFYQNKGKKLCKKCISKSKTGNVAPITSTIDFKTLDLEPIEIGEMSFREQLEVSLRTIKRLDEENRCLKLQYSQMMKQLEDIMVKMGDSRWADGIDDSIKVHDQKIMELEKRVLPQPFPFLPAMPRKFP